MDVDAHSGASGGAERKPTAEADAASAAEARARVVFEAALRPWQPVSSMAVASSDPARHSEDDRFSLHPGTSVAADTSSAYAIVVGEVTSRLPGATACLLEDAVIYGCGFIVRSQDAFIDESKYLNTYLLDRRFANSLRDRDPEPIDPDLVWIVGGNASMRNYWHWLAQSLPAITQCRDWLVAQGLRVGILVPKMQPWQREALILAGLGGEPLRELTVFQSVRARRVCYSTLLGARHAYTPSIYRRIVRERMLAATPVVAGPKRFFVSRRDSGKRPLTNEAAIAAALSALDFTLLCPGEMSVAEQVAAFSGAEAVVAPHGAGGANYLFCPPGASIVELQQASYTNSSTLGMCRTSGARAWLEVYPDDGLGMHTLGWAADPDGICATLTGSARLAPNP